MWHTTDELALAFSLCEQVSELCFVCNLTPVVCYLVVLRARHAMQFCGLQLSNCHMPPASASIILPQSLLMSFPNCMCVCDVDNERPVHLITNLANNKL